MTRDCRSIDQRGVLCRRAFAGTAAAVLALAALRVAKAQGTQSIGAVEFIKGEAFAEGRSRRALERNSPLFIADLVTTGEESRLTIQLGQQTRIQLGERVRLVIDRYLVDAGGELTLQAGAMLFDRPPPASPVPVQIRSTFGLIAVRGTRFFAGPSGDVFGVFVQRGSVSVTAAGREVVLLMGQGTDIPNPGDKPRTARRWRDRRIKDALASVS